MIRILVGFITGCLVAGAMAALSTWPFPNVVEAPGFKFKPVAAAIGTCNSGETGTAYYDTTGNNLCVCNGTNWVDVKDASTTCS